MNFFYKIHETQITRRARRPLSLSFDRPVLATAPCPRETARAAVLEILG